MDREAMAKKLRKLRGNRSRQEVADACNISVSALAMYERGERMPKDEIKVRLSTYYNRTINHIFFTQKEHKTCSKKRKNQ